MKKIENVGIVGMGALGTLFGYAIQEKLGKEHVYFGLDEERYARYSKKTFRCNGKVMDCRIMPASKAEPVDLLIVATKTTGLVDALDTMEPMVNEDTTIISVLNGVTSETIIAERFGMQHVIMTIAQGMDAMYFDDELTYINRGKLCIGVPADGSDEQRERLTRLMAFFDEMGIPYQEESDILHRLWGKFMLNVGINQVCMVFSTGYGGAIQPASLERMVLISAMREAKMLANLEGILISEEDLEQYIALMASLEPDAMPSMAQDRVNQRPSEVETFAGTVIRLGKKYQLQVPVNEYLYRRVMEIEADYPNCN